MGSQHGIYYLNYKNQKKSRWIIRRLWTIAPIKDSEPEPMLDITNQRGIQMEGSCNITASVHSNVSPYFSSHGPISITHLATHEDRGLSKRTVGHGVQMDINFQRPKIAPSPDSKSKSNLSPRERTQISTTLKDLKDAERMVLIVSSFSSPVWLLQKQDKSWRMNETTAKSTKRPPL